MRKPYKIVRKSPFSGKTNEMMISLDPRDYERWLDGETIQSVFYYLTADEREFIMTGITPEEWPNE